MASGILNLTRILASSSSNLRRTSSRRFCHSVSRYPFVDIRSHLQRLGQFLYPSLVLLESVFVAPDDPEIHNSRRRGAGVCLDPTLVVTSAHLVGRIATLHESRTVGKPDQFEHDSILHKSYVATTVAYTVDGKMLNTMPIAVNFAMDVAVLRVVRSGETVLRHRALAKFPPLKETIMMAFAQEPSSEVVIKMGNVRGLTEKTIRAKAPWPLDDELAWLEHDWFMTVGGDPPPGSMLLNCKEKVIGSTTRISGSPWFNLDGEVIGIASWEVVDEPAKFSVGFAAPLACIRSVVEYAQTKAPGEAIVMDRWINAHLIPRD